MKKRLLLLFSLLLYFGAFAETLDECQRLAEQNYPLVKRYDLIRQTTDYTVANLNRGWLPQIAFSAQATLQSEVVTLPDALNSVMAMQGLEVKGLKKDQYKVALDVQQNIWDGGAISAQKEIARRESEVQNAQTDVDLYAVRDRVANLYFGILLLQEKGKLVDANIALMASNVKRLETLFDGGVAMKSDVASLKAQLLEAQQQRTDIDCFILALRQMLNLFCGKDIASVEMPDLAESLLNNTQLENRPEWKLLDKQSALLRARENALDAMILPHVSLFAQGFYGYPGLNMYDDMFSHNWSLNGIIGLRMNWNISGFYTRSNDKKKLSLQRGQIENAREVFTFNTGLQQTQERQYFERCQKLLSQDDEVIELRKSVREAAESKLENGIIDINGLLLEMTREQQALIKRVEHEIEMQQHLAEMRYFSGEK